MGIPHCCGGGESTSFILNGFWYLNEITRSIHSTMVYSSKYQVELFNVQEYNKPLSMSKLFPYGNKLFFRTKNHSLPNVIQGRGRNRRPYNERLCPTCNVLGDKFYCLFECENTRHFRHVYYPANTLLGQICLTSPLSYLLKNHLC